MRKEENSWEQKKRGDKRREKRETKKREEKKRLSSELKRALGTPYKISTFQIKYADCFSPQYMHMFWAN